MMGLFGGQGGKKRDRVPLLDGLLLFVPAVGRHVREPAALLPPDMVGIPAGGLVLGITSA